MKRLLTMIFIISVIPLLITSNVLSAENIDPSVRVQQIENKIATNSSKSLPTSSQAKVSAITYLEGRLLASSNGSVLILGTLDGTKILYTSDSTKYIAIESAGKKLIGFGDLKLGDSVLVLGIASGETSGNAKIIIRSSPIAESKSFSIISRITEIKENSLILKDYKTDNLVTVNVSYTAETLTTTKSKTIKISDLRTNNKIVVLGVVDEKGNLISKEIMQLAL